MSATRTAYVDGIGFWSAAWPHWSAARLALRSEAEGVPPAAAARPAPQRLAANERRRAPDAVLLALEVAEQALAAAGLTDADVVSVFASAHGDLPITDAMCRTLAQSPTLLSPTRFHHSVHNAASGYWAIATGSHAASTALAAFDGSFAAGLLEALCQCEADAQPVLLAACDTEARGPLLSVNRSRGELAMGLVLSPRRGPGSAWALEWWLQPGPAAPLCLHSGAAQALSGNASADALPLAEALARDAGAELALPLGHQLSLQLCLRSLTGPRATAAQA